MAYKLFAVLKNEYYADVVSYVIMPIHLHVILHFHHENFNLNTIIANGKRFIAYEMINQLEEKGNTELLHHLASLVTEREKKKGQMHKVFKDSFDAKAIITDRFLMQKISYIHNNPLSGKWMLAKDFVEYEYSCASFYEIQVVRHHRPMHYLNMKISRCGGVDILFAKCIQRRGFTEVSD